MRSRTNTTCGRLARALHQQQPALPRAPQRSSCFCARQGDRAARRRHRHRATEVRFRTSTTPCNGCHTTFRSLLASAREFRRYRALPSRYSGRHCHRRLEQLPESAGGARVNNAIELEKVIADNGLFGKCLTSNLMKYALGDVTLVEPTDCSVSAAYECLGKGGPDLRQHRPTNRTLGNSLQSRWWANRPRTSTQDAASSRGRAPPSAFTPSYAAWKARRRPQRPPPSACSYASPGGHLPLRLGAHRLGHHVHAIAHLEALRRRGPA